MNKIKITALLLAAVVALGAIGTWMAGTFATPDPVKFDQNPYSDSSILVEIDPVNSANNTFTRTIFSSDAKSTDTDVLQVSLSNSTATITLVGPGRATLAYGAGGTVNSTLKYQVKDPRYITEYTLLNGNSGKIAAKDGTLQINITTVPAAPLDSIKWKSLNKDIADVDLNSGLITAKNDSGTAIIVGEVRDQWGVTQTIPFSVTIGRFVNILGPDSDGNYYLPTDTEHVYVIVDENGNVKIPIEYVWDGTDDPANSTDKKPCVPGDDGKHYVEDPEYKNIWHEIDAETGEETGNSVWGGFDGKPGGGDDTDVIFDNTNKNWWAHLGQNVYQKVSNTTGQLHGDLIGGGPDESPLTQPASPIIYVGGKYYIGPMIDEGVEYYYGDKLIGGNGRVMSNSNEEPHFTDDIYYLVNGLMTTTKPQTAIPPEVGTKFYMGNDKDNNRLEWQVLEVNESENKMLVITTTVAAEYLFHSTIPYTPTPGWENSDMRNYLKNTFINNFTTEEQQRILVTNVETKVKHNDDTKVTTQDKLFLLSSEEIGKYWTIESQRIPAHTVCGVRSSNAKVHTSWGYNRYWLRDPMLDVNSAAYITNDGSILPAAVIYGKGALSSDRNQGGVRPAMWITIN